MESNITHTITQKSNSNFAGSFFFLPPDQRHAIEAVYAFSRLADDAVDESGSPEEARVKLADWRHELHLVYHGTPTHPVMQELARVVREFSIPEKYFEELLQGVEVDLQKQRYSNFEELCDYTYGVASVVGLICMKIFRVEGKEAEKAAILLGRALQLTNILRDIKGDAMNGRIYLPEQDLNQFNLKEEDIFQARRSARFDSLMHFEIDRVEKIYDQAFSLMKDLPRKPLIAAYIMGKIYYRILKEIKKNPRIPLERKLKLSSLTKIGIVAKEWMRSRI